jgi:hypothetical protein
MATQQAFKDEKAEIIDDHREYKDMCTDIVVKQFLSSDVSMFNFLKLVYQTFDQALDIYKKAKGMDKWDIFFVYKGGNILRIIANDFLGELPTMASRNIHKYYDKFFRRSDADFSIYVNPSIPNYDVVYQDVTNLSYLLQVYIRTIFSDNLASFFDFYKYSTEYRKSLLDKYIDILKASRSITDVKNKSYYGLTPIDIIFDDNKSYVGKVDLQMKMCPDKKSTITTDDLNDQLNAMYIQKNETLDFKSSAGRVKFNLVRTKILFNLMFKTPNGQVVLHPVGGELIDVSIPHKFDNNLIHFYDVGVDYIQQYKLTNEDNNIELSFYSYKYTYLSHDLEYILFKFVNKPWETPKYEKRLNRLMYLYYIDLFVKLQDMPSRKRAVAEMTKLLSNSKFSDETLIQNLQKCAAKYDEKDLLIAVLPRNITRIIENELQDNGDIVEYNKMIDVIMLNFIQMTKSFDGVKAYCSQDGTIKLDILYDNEFSSLIGGKLPSTSAMPLNAFIKKNQIKKR